MSRTTETARHSFVPFLTPTKERAELLKQNLTYEGDCYQNVEVFCVVFGEVKWAEGAYYSNTCLYGRQDKLPHIGSEYGFLIRTVYQFTDPSDEEVKEDKRRSWDDYHKLVQHLSKENNAKNSERPV